MDKFQVGGVVYHKATKQRCVIIEKNKDGTLKVRTQTDDTKHYYPQELETDEEIKQKNQAQAEEANRLNQERAKKIREGYGF